MPIFNARNSATRYHYSDNINFAGCLKQILGMSIFKNPPAFFIIFPLLRDIPQANGYFSRIFSFFSLFDEVLLRALQHSLLLSEKQDTK